VSDANKLELARAIHGTPHATRDSFSPSTWAGVERAWAWVVDAYVARIKRHPSFQNLTDAGEEYVRGLAERAASDFFAHAKTASPNDTTVFVVDQPKEPTVKQEPWTVDDPHATEIYQDDKILRWRSGNGRTIIIHKDAFTESNPPELMIFGSGDSIWELRKWTADLPSAESETATVRGDAPQRSLSDLSPGLADRVPPCGDGTPRAESPSTSEAPTPPWTEAQREAAHDLFHELDDADTTNGCPEVLVCAAIAKVAPMFVDKPRFEPVSVDHTFREDGIGIGVVCGRQGSIQKIPWSEILKHVPPGSVVESVKFHAATPAPSPAPAASHPGIPDNSAEPAPATDGVPDLDECMRTYWLAHSAHESADDPKREAVSAVRDLFVRTRDERIAELERNIARWKDEEDSWKEIDDLCLKRIEEADERIADMERRLAKAEHVFDIACNASDAKSDTIATLTKERDEWKRVSDRRDEDCGKLADSRRDLILERDAALARVAELEKRGAVDVEACAREINEMAYQQSKGYIESGYYLGWRNIEAILRKHSRDVRRITREELYRMADAHYEARTGSCLSSAPPESALKIREEIAVCLQAALRAIGFEVEA